MRDRRPKKLSQYASNKSRGGLGPAAEQTADDRDQQHAHDDPAADPD
jgi:hypothetical protein